ncbi:hypothetical protein [Brevibacillus sp. DP1.3A]|uniref:hypothetical protein n=1 Tax=Brevibacillus sp. DP1.3A TaxID=2738867 RepID=UPI00156AAE39|nr:hypothetical protein [Brevibacillus sp. DP1.3A]UED74776.1 hypothetical protein HP399_029510 [Brevibacillus sp. DP1.3A]
MNKRAKALFLVFFLGFCFIIFTYVSLIWYPALPFESKSKREVTELLGENTGSIVKLTTEGNVDWYGYGPQANQASAAEAMKRTVTEKGWTFIQQEGAGYFFERGKEKMIITSQMWTGNYVLFRIPAGVI